ncbi:carboxypeptidase-like regulatory domain-containing protein [Virgibacillus soli]|uniref:Carboxypeptidase-like regulatory domain-containing protein n=1 Tax=Paracerasibacillus soli TaxID=480284 RepID=A0ABU5CTK2_9BACI|nr:carboxypeptidase regulatory-like domain-containing protein [Virgibacillus soli]MDY0408760.1 carboxypeptidase-like regulatory domain-containing protein [Virgibacillus soli]
MKLKSWHNFEESSAGRAWDYGHVVISTDQEEWTELHMVQGQSNGWEDIEVDLSDYSGRVYLGFYAYSDISVNKEGWYIDDVELAAESGASSNKVSLGVEKNAPVKNEKPKAKVASEKVEKNHDVKPMLLPLGAKVSVLESGRSVNTNPADGSYSFVHAAGEYTLVADAYGYASEQKAVNIEADQTVTANFTLNELPQATITGTVTHEKTGNPIEGATVIVVEDANIAPVETDENGNFTLTAYEGTYTLRVVASDFYKKELEVNLDGNVDLNVELEPFYTVPGGEIAYDDGTAENALSFYDAGNGWAMKMSLPEGKETAIVTDGVFQFWDTEWPVPGGTEFAVEVWDASGAGGLPGKKLAGPVQAEANRDGTWTEVDLSEHNIVVDGDFYMVYIQTQDNPYAPGLATDEDGPFAERSYQLVGGAWSATTDEGNYMIRARVSYEVGQATITTPEENYVTNEPALTVEGTASPTTSVKLLNNGEEVGVAEIGDDGLFSFDTELTEGENEFTAVTVIDEDEVNESEPVTVTLDTTAPELTIDSPQKGDKTNRETVTVVGTVSDTNLDKVTVNGQEVKVKDGNYSQRILLDEGENTIEVVATDLAGNSTTKSVVLEAKYTAPKVENVTPAEDMHVKAGQTVLVSFDSEPGLKATFTVHMPLTNLPSLKNVTELPMFEMSPGHYVAYWTVPGNLVAEGAVVEVQGKDKFGNEARAKAEGKLFISSQETNAVKK